MDHEDDGSDKLDIPTASFTSAYPLDLLHDECGLPNADGPKTRHQVTFMFSDFNSIMNASCPVRNLPMAISYTIVYSLSPNNTICSDPEQCVLLPSIR